MDISSAFDDIFMTIGRGGARRTRRRANLPTSYRRTGPVRTTTAGCRRFPRFVRVARARVPRCRIALPRWNIGATPSAGRRDECRPASRVRSPRNPTPPKRVPQNVRVAARPDRTGHRLVPGPLRGDRPPEREGDQVAGRRGGMRQGRRHSRLSGRRASLRAHRRPGRTNPRRGWCRGCQGRHRLDHCLARGPARSRLAEERPEHHRRRVRQGGRRESPPSPRISPSRSRPKAQRWVCWTPTSTGPSQPRMLGAQGQPDSRDGKSLEPMTSYRVQSMSIGYLIEEDTPMIWRGPMVTQALEQLLRDTNWRDLDYLVVDLPPGTGDIQLTLAQRIPGQRRGHRHQRPRTSRCSTPARGSGCSRRSRCRCSESSKT